MVANIEKDLKTIAKQIKFLLPNGEAYLFGSYAYGTPHENSDLDILVVCPDKSIRKIELIQKIRKSFSREVNMPVDLLIDYNDEFAERKKNHVTLEHKVANEGINLNAYQ